MADYKLNVSVNEKPLRHQSNPKYLGITLDRSLTYKEHLNKTAGKDKITLNIIQKLV